MATIPCPTADDIARFSGWPKSRNYARETIRNATNMASRLAEFFPAGDIPADRDAAVLALSQASPFAGKPYRARHNAVWALYRYLDYRDACTLEAV